MSDETEAWRETVRDRLSAAMRRRGISQRALAERLGITGSAVAQWMGRDSAFRDWQTLSKVAPLLHVSVDYLLGLNDEPEGPPAPEVVALDEEDWSKLPVLLEQVGAGEPILDPAEEPSVHAFNRGWLRRTYGTDDPRLVWLFKVARDHKGESMAPTILPGSVCLVGPLLTTTEGQLAIEDDGIHLLFLGPEHRGQGQEGFIVKRVQLQPTGLFVYSDNPSPEHRPFLLHVEGDLRQVIRGRIKWVSQEL